MKIDFKFELGEEVKVKAMNRPGTILACACRGHLSGQPFIEYRVVFWEGGARKDEWLLEQELAK